MEIFNKAATPYKFIQKLYCFLLKSVNFPTLIYCFLHKKMNFPVPKGSEITGFGFSYLRPVLEPGLPQYPVIELGKKFSLLGFGLQVQ
jgi:hypothetical protein